MSYASRARDPSYIRTLSGSGGSSGALIAAALRQMKRHENADCFEARTATEHAAFRQDRVAAYREMSERRGRYERHRESERQTADYFRRVLYPATGNREYATIADKLESCRRSGVYGYADSGKLMIAWDDKCNLARLCPDEAAAESQRLEGRYSSLLKAEARAGRRVYKAVFTLRNYPAGRLAEGKKHIFKRFRDRVLRAVKAGRQRFPITGALVIQEDPLSAHDDWNIHLNVILVTSGFLNFGDLRAHWGAQIEIKQHHSFSAGGMHRLFAECVKYAVRCIPEKSAEHAAGGKSDAPALTQWPAARADEWWQAGSGFRRTRGYGCLYGKGELAAAQDALHKMELGSVRWLGRIEMRADGLYGLDYGISSLDLIRGHKLPIFDTAGEWDRFYMDAGPPV